jgi:signal peptidase I
MKQNKSYLMFKEFAKSVITSLIFVLVLTNFVVKPIKVNGSSMYPTLKDESLGFSNILSYKLFGVNRFDVVIVYVESLNEYLVKRVIALPNETIEIKESKVYIDGVELEQTFLDLTYVIESGFNPFTTSFESLKLGDDEIFLMGDNRPKSSDSRMFGPFKLDDIIAKDAYIFYPFNEINWFKGE